jgi:hypothetical protein
MLWILKAWVGKALERKPGEQSSWSSKRKELEPKEKGLGGKAPGVASSFWSYPGEKRQGMSPVGTSPRGGLIPSLAKPLRGFLGGGKPVVVFNS